MLTEISKKPLLGGYQYIYSHFSESVHCIMKFGVYLPPQAANHKVPVLYWLSGLTCNEQNFISKIDAQRYAAETGICLVNPDTSPRECGIHGEDDKWNFGTNAGYYIDATEDPWKKHYRMYSYVSKELPDLLKQIPSIETSKASIFGHSMGGHGAMIIYLKNPGKYNSVSAFAPMCNPIESSFGKMAFTSYLGKDKKKWEEYDTCCLAEKYSGDTIHILIDHGSKDGVTHEMLPHNLKEICDKNKSIELNLRIQEGYGHGDDFINAFIMDHIKYHAKYLS